MHVPWLGLAAMASFCVPDINRRMSSRKFCVDWPESRRVKPLDADDDGASWLWSPESR